MSRTYMSIHISTFAPSIFSQVLHKVSRYIYCKHIQQVLQVHTLAVLRNLPQKVLNMSIRTLQVGNLIPNKTRPNHGSSIMPLLSVDRKDSLGSYGHDRHLLSQASNLP